MPETGARKWIITATVVLASVIELIDTSIVNVALPQIMGNLGATLDEAAWVVTAYVVANVIVVPMAGWLARLFGRRNYFGGSIILFTAASVFCGNAHTIWELVAFRFIQGLGGGALITTSQSILVETFPPEELGFASALFGMGVVTGPTLGPVLGGWITDTFSWPWIFYVNLPIGILATLFTFTYIRDPEGHRSAEGVDWPGIGLLTVGIGALQVVLERGEREDWFSSKFIVTLSVVAALGLLGFLWRELTTDQPVVNLRVLRDRSLAVGTVLTFVLGFGLYASIFVFPVFTENLLGFTPMQTGWILLPGGLATTMMMPFVGKSLQRGFPPRLLIATGFLIFLLFCQVLSWSTLATSREEFFWPLILRGVGLSLIFVPITTAALGNLRGPDIPQGAGLTNMMRQLGGSFGTALVATFVQKQYVFNRAGLLEHLTVSDPPVQQRLAALTHGFLAQGLAPPAAQHKALAVMEGMLSRQSLLLTYMDTFRRVGMFFLVCLPLVFLLRPVRRGGPGTPVH